MTTYDEWKTTDRDAEFLDDAEQEEDLRDEEQDEEEGNFLPSI